MADHPTSLRYNNNFNKELAMYRISSLSLSSVNNFFNGQGHLLANKVYFQEQSCPTLGDNKT